jgi:glutamine amidotransferase
MISILDYGCGNLGSVARMIQKLGTAVEIINTPQEVERAQKLIIPGVGAFDEAMAALKKLNLDGSIVSVATHREIPVLGICLGMQLLFERSEEGQLNGLGLISGNIIKLRSTSDKVLKIPHMGWNEINVSRTNSLMTESQEIPRFYFVHTYHAICTNPTNVIATAEYGGVITAAVQEKNIFGVQFHPEKSHRFGMALMHRFIDLPNHAET